MQHPWAPAPPPRLTGDQGPQKKNTPPGGNQGGLNTKEIAVSKHSLTHLYRDSVVTAYSYGIVTGATIALTIVFLAGGAR